MIIYSVYVIRKWYTRKQWQISILPQNLTHNNISVTKMYDDSEIQSPMKFFLLMNCGSNIMNCLLSFPHKE